LPFDTFQYTDYDDSCRIKEPPPPVNEGGITILQEAPSGPLEFSKLYIQRHPHAKDKPVHPGPIRMPSSQSLYWPFNTREDFEQVEIFFKANSTNPIMDAQLQLNMRNQGKNAGPYTLKSARDVHKTLGKAFSFPEEKVRIHLDPPLTVLTLHVV
jgi:hypothetical protein